MDKNVAHQALVETLGDPVRSPTKVSEWRVGNVGLVLQKDQPNRENAAYIWLPYPGDGESVPDLALEYPAESGRHSGTYAALGLHKGEPALKLVVRSHRELELVIAYARAMGARAPLPTIIADCTSSDCNVLPVDVSSMPRVSEPKPKREAIPRSVQREVWQRDGGRCVECSTREKLCFDHIVPFSRGGSNTVRNIQLLCESCNLGKGNRI